MCRDQDLIPIIGRYFDTYVREVAHDFPRIAADMAGLRLHPDKPLVIVFESPHGAPTRHDIGVIATPIDMDPWIQAHYGQSAIQRWRKRKDKRLVIAMEWQSRWVPNIVERSSTYAAAIWTKHKLPVHSLVVTLSPRLPSKLTSVTDTLSEGRSVFVVSLPQQDMGWLTPEFPLRAVFTPALKGGTTVESLTYALELLTTLHKHTPPTRFLSLLSLLSSLAELFSCYPQLEEAMRSLEEYNVPAGSELTADNYFGQVILRWRDRVRNEGREEGRAEEADHARHVLLKSLRMLVTPEQYRKLAALTDIDEIYKRLAELQGNTVAMH